MLNLRLRPHVCSARRAFAAASSSVLLLVAAPTAHSQALAQQSLSAMTPVSRAPEATPSRIGAGDTIRINVYQNPDLSMETRVNETGAISYPLLGYVQVAGMTVVAAEQQIASELRQRDFVKSPQVQILVTQVRANQVNVLGQVGRPGRYPLDLNQMRLTEVLALAGGIVAASGSDTVVVTGMRDGQPFRKDVDMRSLFRDGNGSQDVVIAPGDSIFVDRAPQIYLYGEIQHPGTIRLEPRMTLMQAIAAGGGATERGTLRAPKVVRTGADGKQQTLELSMEDRLSDGDVVYIRESLF